MKTTNTKTRIILTNWISVVGILIAVYLSGIISELIIADKNGDISNSLWVGFIGGIIGLVLYGAVFFIGFMICMSILDLLLIGKTGKHLRAKLLIEWILISTPFMYWIFKYSEWVFLIAIIAFFVTQVIRERLVLKIIAGVDTSPSPSE